MTRDLALATAMLGALGASGASPSTAAAEAPNRVDVGVFAGVDRLGGDSELGNAWAAEQVPGTGVLFGLRGGLLVVPDLSDASALDPGIGVELEGTLALGSTGEMPSAGRASYGTRVIGGRAHVVGRLGLGGRVTPHVVAGVGLLAVSSSSPYMADDTDLAFHWGPGASLRVAAGFEVRLDLRHGLTPGRESSVTSTFAAHLGVARAIEWGGPPPRPRRVVEDATPEPVDDGDEDNDGIKDADDACRDLPEILNGIDDADGCPDTHEEDHEKAPPVEEDRDADGVTGAADACPDQPEDRDGYEDANGCPDPDNDGDGLADAQDTCPGEPEAFNGFQDTDGCPEALPAKLQEFGRVLEGVVFETGKARIRTASRKQLDKTAAILRELPELRVRIEGHTDEGGSPEKDLALSQKRADAVKWYLVDKGIAADRIETAGFGATRPLEGASKAKSRRIELHLVETR